MSGDAVCLVVAQSREIAEEAKKLIRVTYEPLQPVRNVDEAKSTGAPLVHSRDNLCQSRHVTRGDAKTALAHSAHKITRTFTTPFTEHAFLEPECAVAFPYKDGIKILSSGSAASRLSVPRQGAYDTLKEVAHMFGWPPERVVVENALVGGVSEPYCGTTYCWRNLACCATGRHIRPADP